MNNSKKNNLKQIIYLDEYKMFSLSSQLRKGLTDYLLGYGEHNEEVKETQTGPFFSGKSWECTDWNTRSLHERRTLHDYAYTLFESALFKEKLILEVGAESSQEELETITSGMLVKVSGLADFYDMQAVGDLIKNFNEIGYAIAYVTNHNAIIAKEKNSGKSTHEPGKAKDNIKERDPYVTTLAEKANLRHDPKFLDNLEKIILYGYGNHFELRMHLRRDDSEKPFFSALLDRNYLREKEDVLIKKFSRKASGTFSLVGVVCQGLQDKALQDQETAVIQTQHEHFREATDTVVSALCAIDQGFFGRFKNEIIVDPIAFYREVIQTLQDDREGSQV